MLNLHTGTFAAAFLFALASLSCSANNPSISSAFDGGTGYELLLVPNELYVPGTIISSTQGKYTDIGCFSEAAFKDLPSRPSQGGSIEVSMASDSAARIQTNILQAINANAEFRTKYKVAVKLDNVRTITTSGSDLLARGEQRSKECTDWIDEQPEDATLSVVTSTLLADIVVEFTSSETAGVGIGTDSPGVAEYIQGNLGKTWRLDNSNNLRGLQLTIGYRSSVNPVYIRRDASRRAKRAHGCPPAMTWNGNRCMHDEMARIPGGSLAPDLASNIASSAQVNPFEIDVTEVTVAEYDTCVNHGACTEPRDVYETVKWIHDWTGTTCTWFWKGEDKAAHLPINCVTMRQATQFCNYNNKRLPTHKEWVFAALGSSKQKYPWGTEPIGNQLCWQGLRYFEEHDVPEPDICAVGSYRDGASMFGVLDMAGSLGEWVNEGNGQFLTLGNDWLTESSRDAEFNKNSNDNYNPKEHEEYLWRDIWIGRQYKDGLGDHRTGFRCARSVSPTTTPAPPATTAPAPPATTAPAPPATTAPAPPATTAPAPPATTTPALPATTP